MSQLKSISATAVVEDADNKFFRMRYIDISARPDLCNRLSPYQKQTKDRVNNRDVVNVTFIAKSTKFGLMYVIDRIV